MPAYRRETGFSSKNPLQFLAPTETTRLDDPDAIPRDSYGLSVAIDGETVVIGAYTRNYTGPEEAGVVFVGRIP